MRSRFFAAVILVVWAQAGMSQQASGPTREQGVELVLESVTSGAIDARTSRLVALYVPESDPVSPFLEPGPFIATFRGSIELDLNDSYQFSVRGAGAARLVMGDRVVLETQALPPDNGAVATAAEIDLSKGSNAFELVYRSPAEGDAALRLTWSNELLSEEPLPPESLRRSDTPLLARSRDRRSARLLFADSLCARCHPVTANEGVGPENAMPELDAVAPHLEGVGSRLRASWVERWLQDPQGLRPEARMPEVLSADPDQARKQAADIAAFLSTLTTDSQGDQETDDKETGDQETLTLSAEAEGERLYSELGCDLCHQDETFPLERTSDKWRPAGLVEFLLNPAATSPSTRMPHFSLDVTEAEALAAFLLARGEGSRSAITPETTQSADLQRGEKLVRELGCLGCHRLESLGDAAPPGPRASDLQGAPLPWLEGSGTAAASEAGPDHGHPRYDFDEVETASLARWLLEDLASLGRTVLAEVAERQIAALRCSACHARDGEPGAWSLPKPATAAEDGTNSEAETVDLRPPDLTWAGEKLRADWLTDFLGGRISERPRPYLLARMPAFGASAEGIATGLHHQHGLAARDRTAIDGPAIDGPEGAIVPELAAIGKDLVGGDRLGCHSCHALGDDPALGGSGSNETINFALVPQRLRRSFFDRFLRDPQRILPGSKMPQFVDEDGYTALYDVFDGEASRQFEAIWHYSRSLESTSEPP